MNRSANDQAAFFRALSHPARVTLLRLTWEEALSGETLARLLNLAPATVSHHLSQLTEAGLMTVRQDGHHRLFGTNRPALDLTLSALVRGEAIERPVYDFTTDDRAAETVRLEPQPVVVVEGILVLHEPSVRERFDLCVFVDAPPDERFIRRLERDVSERGRSAASVIEQYRRSVRPMHDLFVEPTKAYAHLIVPEGGNNRVALEVLSTYVESFVARTVQDAVIDTVETP